MYNNNKNMLEKKNLHTAFEILDSDLFFTIYNSRCPFRMGNFENKTVHSFIFISLPVAVAHRPKAGNFETGAIH